MLGLSFNDLATSEAVRKNIPRRSATIRKRSVGILRFRGLQKIWACQHFASITIPRRSAALREPLARSPRMRPVRAMLGLAYFGQRNLPMPRRPFLRWVFEGMQDSTVGYAWAASLARSGELKKAAEVLGEFEKENHGGNDGLLLIGQLWIEIGDYARAVDTFHRVLESDSSLRKAHYFAGQADIRWEHWPEAAAEFQAELKLEPTDPEAMYNLGFVYLQQSRVG